MLKSLAGFIARFPSVNFFVWICNTRHWIIDMPRLLLDRQADRHNPLLQENQYGKNMGRKKLLELFMRTLNSSLAVVRCFLFTILSLSAIHCSLINPLYAQGQTELGVKDDLSVFGTNGTFDDPNVEIKGFTVFGSTQTSYTGAVNGPGNVVVNGTLAVSSGAYFTGVSTFSSGMYVMAPGSAATDMAQIWRNSGGAIVSSMSATGVMMATKFVGDGSGLIGVAAGSYPGYINASQVNSGSFQNGAYTFPNTLTVTGAAAFNNPGATTSQANSFNSGTNAIAAMFGSGSTIGFTADQYGGAVRFNGAGVLWGDLSFYPNGGGNGSQGNFRFSTTGSILGTTPAGKVGVGELYSVGNVGIGTTNPGAQLEVVGDATNLQLKLGRKTDYTGNGTLYANSIVALGLFANGGSPEVFDVFQNGGIAAGTYAGTAPPANGMIISGNVGIGITNPQTGSMLHVRSGLSLAVMPTNNQAIFEQPAGINGGIGIAYNNSTAGFYGHNAAGAYDWGIEDAGSRNIGIRAGGANRITILSGGNVGIGTTAPGAKLEVNAGSNDGLRINNGTVNGVVFNTNNNSMTVGTISNHDLNLFTNNSSKVTVQAGGNVGIGTASPGTNLEVKGGVSGQLMLPLSINSGYYLPGSAIGIGFQTDGSAYYTKGALVYASNGSGWNIGNFHFLLRNDASYATPVTLADAKMTILAGGNVGIGTASPVATLDVNGTVKFSGGSTGQYLVKGADGNLNWATPSLSCYNSYDGSDEYGGACNAGYVSVFKANIYMMGIAQQWVRVCCKIQ